MDQKISSSYHQSHQMKKIPIIGILILGSILLGCSNHSLSNSSSSPENTDNLPQIVIQSDPGSDSDLNGHIDVAPLIEALEAEGLSEGEIIEHLNNLIDAIEQEGYTQGEIIKALDRLILGFDGTENIAESNLMFIELMNILKSSQEDQISQKTTRDTALELNENNSHAPSVSYDPELELSSYLLICPSIPQTNPIIPLGPYDTEIGDCSLMKKTAEIEAWLTELEQIAASCQANRDINWAAALAARTYLDTRVDELEEIGAETPQEGEEGTSINTSFSLVLGLLQAVRGTGSSPEENTNPEGSMFNTSSHYHTDMLQSLSENVEIYCTMVDEIIMPLHLACKEINLYQGIQPPDPELYHSIIEFRMNDVEANYNSTDLFFTNNLQTYGWDGFRSSFSEISLNCPFDPLNTQTTFTFEMNTFCRRGPSSEYQAVATFLEGEQVLIEGRNLHEPRWWVVANPGARDQCWVSDSTGSTEGPLEDIEIVTPPALIINPPSNDQSKAITCKGDLSQSDCVAAGGHWNGGATGAPCVCP